MVLGLSLGVAAGFLFGEWFAGEGARGVARAFTPWRHRARERPDHAELTADLQSALERVLGPDAQSLELVPVGRNALELHGWVTSRQSRSRAIRVARESLGDNLQLVDRLLVWGEDDQPKPSMPPREELESG